MRISDWSSDVCSSDLAMWETEPAPASFNLFAIPDQENQTNHFSVEIPYLMGIIGTRSLTTPLLGIEDLVERAKARVKNGIIAYEALQKVRADPQDTAARNTFDATGSTEEQQSELHSLMH